METKYTFTDNSKESVNFTNYYWFKNAFSKEELVDIERMTSELDFIDAAIGQDDSSRNDNNYRKSRIKWCPQNEKWHWVYSRLHDLIKEANDVMWKFDLKTMDEMIQYTEYYGGGGHYDWHMDCGIGIQNKRKVSVTVQLSDSNEYDGGDLQFMLGSGEIDAPREMGAAVIFPSFYLHRITPVSSGTRKSFVLWVGGEPYR